MRQCLFIGLGLFLGLCLNTWKGEAVGMPIQIERMNPPGTSQPTAYTQLVRAGKTLYFAGQTAVNEKGELIGKGDMRAQVRQVYENLKSLLASQGATFDHLVKITIYTLSASLHKYDGVC